MKISKSELWQRFLSNYKEYPEIGLSLDLSRVDWPADFFARMTPQVETAFQSMSDLEKGAVANPDEGRRVGHYWLRAADLAPEAKISTAIRATVQAIKLFASKVHAGEIRGQTGVFKNVIVIGIGGSALGPLFVSNALGHPKKDKLQFYVLDNTDPDGMDKVFARIADELGQTLCVVISKSGGTKETRNGMMETRLCYEKAGLIFEQHAVAITQDGSQLDEVAVHGRWIERFPMWDWVGGRTSELSAVGLLPAAIQGIDIDNLLFGAMKMDQITRNQDLKSNPAMGLALAWYAAGNGKGDKNLVVLPYKDCLELFSKYLQQLIMESIGKQLDLKGQVVHQGLSVFGNKGSTDQHSFVQQLRDGRNDFLVIFVEVLLDRLGDSVDVEPGLTVGDYLQGFLLGTRVALTDSARQSITITINEVDAQTIGALIALFERAVGFYASLVSINAYHQPGVEAGKKAASEIVELKRNIESVLKRSGGVALTPEDIAGQIDGCNDFETVFKVCKRLSANPQTGVQALIGKTPAEARFKI